MAVSSGNSRRKRRPLPPAAWVILVQFVSLVICLAVIVNLSRRTNTPEVPGGSMLDNSIPDIHAEKPEMLSGKSDVTVIATGGTIAGISSGDTDFTSYTPGIKRIEDMIDEISDIKKLANITTQQFANQNSGSVTTQNLYDLSVAVDRALETADAVVITCGTDIMEEIAYFLDLTVQSPKPVVVTGSMKPWNVIGSDAPLNLYNAIKVAASNKTYKCGTVVVLNEEIHAAREVTKSNAVREDTFVTPMLGMLGYVDDGNVSLYRIPTRAAKSDEDWVTPFDLSKIKASDIPRVDIVVSYQGAGGELITAAVKAGARGIVTMGTGNGGLTDSLITARSQALQQGILVAATTRTGSGTLYSEDRDGSGVISADNLNAYHARIALQLSMAYSSDYNTIQKWFDQYIRIDY